ncbi:hypothetical protein D3C87_587990 [compost metagenome]
MSFWTILAIFVALACYTYVLVQLAKEWHARNPYWDIRRVWVFAKTYWCWPVFIIFVLVMIPWELWKTRKIRKEVKDKYDL